MNEPIDSIELEEVEEEEDTSNLIERLKLEFCPLLDFSLLLALLLDYSEPITNLEEIEIRSILSTLALATTTTTSFDEVGNNNNSSWDNQDVNDSIIVPSNYEIEDALLAWSLEEKIGNIDNDKEDSRSDFGNSLIRVDDDEGEEDPIKFLLSVFPSYSLIILQSRLDNASLDIETVVEELLNEDYIKFESSFSTNSSTSTSSNHSTPSSSYSSIKSGSTKQQRRRIKTSLKASQTLSLTDVLHRSSPTPPPPLLPSVTNNALQAATKSRENSWITLDSTSSYLASLLRISPGRITSTYHQLNSSLPLTVSKILTSLVIERPSSTFPPTSLSSLRIVLPNLTLTQLELLLSATEGDVSDSIDLQSFLEELARKEGSLIQNGLIGFGAKTTKGIEVDHGALPPSSTPSSPKKSSRTNLPSDWSTTKKRYNIATSVNLNGIGSSKGFSTVYTVEECVDLARDYHEKRNDAYRSAARHFQKGGGGERGAAFYWADIGRDFDRKKRSWEEKAAFAVVGERRRRNTTDVDQVDLHGLTLNHALTVARSTCNSWWSSASGTPAPLRIITGVGKHSTNQNPILMPAVAKLLDKEGWRWKWDGMGNGSGALLVTGVLR